MLWNACTRAVGIERVQEVLKQDIYTKWARVKLQIIDISEKGIFQVVTSILSQIRSGSGSTRGSKWDCGAEAIRALQCNRRGSALYCIWSFPSASWFGGEQPDGNLRWREDYYLAESSIGVNGAAEREKYASSKYAASGEVDRIPNHVFRGMRSFWESTTVRCWFYHGK